MGVFRKGPQGPSWTLWETLFATILALIFMKGLLVTSAQRQGLSYACGAPKALTTSDGISWESDADIAPPGSNTTVVGVGYVRYFSEYSESNPQQNVHCYNSLPEVVTEGPLLLRVTYEYSNYDGLDAPPEFQMWVGTAQVAYVNLKKNDPWIEEVVYLPRRDSSEQVLCLLAVKGAPVISFIELRPLPANSYAPDREGLLLRKHFRIDCGNTEHTLRYPDDEYDRIWDRDQFFSQNTSVLLANESLDGEDVPERPPVGALNNSRNGTEIQYTLLADTSGSFSVKLYTPSAITPNVQVNGGHGTKSSESGKAIEVTTISGVADDSGTINVVLTESDGDEPEVNALEVFQEIDPGVSSVDAQSMKDISVYYNLKLKWFGDPCLPVPWEGLQCSGDNQVTSLDLSGQNIALPIKSEFSTLKSLTNLNLSFNRFSSQIPSLTGLNQLEVLDLRNNDFSGTLDALTVLPALTQLFVSFNPRLSGEIPPALKRSNLIIDIQGTCIDKATSCTPPSPTKEDSTPSKKSNSGVLIGVIVAVVVVVALLVFVLFCCVCRRRKAKTRSGGGTEAGSMDLRNWSAARVFTFKELETATRHFKKELGEGSFGPVYLGGLPNGQKVAIKMRQDTSQLGADAFSNEVYLLSRVHHPNLVPLLGYCQEGKNQLLVYEYMPGGTLMDHLYGTMTRLDWVARLRIAIGAATGISYLHNESEPKIIHRDVKSTNILLDSNMTAKVSDFGLSKLVSKSEATHVTTLVKGTAGYLDPEYFTTNQLTEKSDVYSFGVVLLELICGREPLSGNRAPDEYNLIAWAKPYLVAQNYSAIVDRGLQNKFNPRSLSLVASLALRCIERNSENRPTMLQVLRELEEALILEDRIEKVIPPRSASNSASNSAAFDFKSTASDTPPDSAPQLANVPSFTFPR